MVPRGAVVRLAEVVSAPHAHNLPVELTSFVGRERELAEAAAELERTRLLSLTGPGGSGKTRLAMVLAARVLDDYPDGVWWLELATVTDPQLVGPALAHTVGVRPLPGMTDLQAAVAFLSSRRALVVLDNCERILDAAGEVAEALLRGCAGVTVLVTSRECLRLKAETDWRVPPLGLPEPAAGADAGSSDSERLFVERAAKVSPGFAVSPANAAALARLCRDLEGMPLAIELAAARLRMMSLEQIARGVSDQLRLLTGGARTALPRHQTLRASVEWSHDLLGAAEQTLFRRLGVFMGGFTLEPVERVCCGKGLDASEMLDLLASLVDKSLVQVERHEGGARYRLLEPVRQFALERLDQAEELNALRDRHRDVFLALAEQFGEPLEVTPVELLEWVEAENPNLTQAIEWAARTEPEKALRLCGAVWLWWHSRGLFAVGEAAYRRALESAPDEPTPLRARVLAGRSYLRLFAGDNLHAVALAEEAVADAEALDDPLGRTLALGVIAGAKMQLEPIAWRPLLEECTAAAREVAQPYVWIAGSQTLATTYLWADDRAGADRILDELLPAIEAGHAHERRGHQWFCYAWSAYVAGELAQARELLDRSVAETSEPNWQGISRAYLLRLDADAGRAAEVIEPVVQLRESMLEQGALMTQPWVEEVAAEVLAATGRLEPACERIELVLQLVAERTLHAIALMQLTRAEALRLLGRPEPATTFAEDALVRGERLHNPRVRACARMILGRLAAARGEWDKAEGLHHQALDALVTGGYRLNLASALEALAAVAAGLASHVEAARLLGAAERVRQEVGNVPWVHQAREIDELRASALDALGRHGFDEAFAQGAALSPDEAVAWVRRARGSRKRPPEGWESLTPTELDVVGHAAAGLINREIGQRMFISAGTVKVHLSHIYAKLDVHNRAELARLAARRLPARD